MNFKRRDVTRSRVQTAQSGKPIMKFILIDRSKANEEDDYN